MFSSPRSLILALIAVAAFAAPPAANAQGNPGDPLARLPGAVGERGDPVAVAAYGALLDADLKPIEPTPEFLRRPSTSTSTDCPRGRRPDPRTLDGTARRWRRASAPTR